jgi:hypothetical protein
MKNRSSTVPSLRPLAMEREQTAVESSRRGASGDLHERSCAVTNVAEREVSSAMVCLCSPSRSLAKAGLPVLFTCRASPTWARAAPARLSLSDDAGPSGRTGEEPEHDMRDSRNEGPEVSGQVDYWASTRWSMCGRRRLWEKMAGPDDRIFLAQLGVVHCRALMESLTDRWAKEPWTHVSVRTARARR